MKKNVIIIEKTGGTMNKQFMIGNKLVGEGAPTFIVAEISGNHTRTTTGQ